MRILEKILDLVYFQVSRKLDILLQILSKTVSRVEKTLQDFRVNILEKTVDLVHFEVSQRFYI